MRNTTALAVLAAIIAVPVLAMSTPPKVEAPVVKTAIPKAEYTKVLAMQTCVRKAYDADPRKGQGNMLGRDVDLVSVATFGAKEAQTLGNREAFNFNRSEVTRMTLALYPACVR